MKQSQWMDAYATLLAFTKNNNIPCVVCVLILWCSQGVVAFSSQGDRIALTQIEQMIDGKYVILGHYDTQADNLTWTGLEKWQDNKVIKSTHTLLMDGLIHSKNMHAMRSDALHIETLDASLHAACVRGVWLCVCVCIVASQQISILSFRIATYS